MQGWRRSQEDTHIADLKLDGNCRIFGVFDGHGGPEVSLFVRSEFVKAFKSLASFQARNYELALSEVFLKMDDMLLSPYGQKELMRIAETFRGTPNFDEERVESPMLQNYTGCTATVVLITPENIFCANAGDSRCVLARSKQKKADRTTKQTNKWQDADELDAIALSEDHKPDDEDEHMRIEAAGGYVEENRVNG